MTLLWTIFAFIMVGFLVVDLGYFNRKAHKVTTKSALIQTGFWVGISFVFAGLIYSLLGVEPAAEFLSAYLTEKMLSVDNLFVILLIFSYMKIESIYQHKILYWGILGAVVFRGIFIGLGSVAIEHFHWILYFFGAFLLYTGVKLFCSNEDDEVDMSQNRVLIWMKKTFRIFDWHNGKFFIEANGKTYITLMFLTLVLIETTDIIFAVDSIPAVFSISQNPFIVFTSNMFAVMGLRALFFIVENALKRFQYLSKGVAAVLVFIGGKMLIDMFGIHISPVLSLVIIVLCLLGSLVISLVHPNAEQVHPTQND